MLYLIEDTECKRQSNSNNIIPVLESKGATPFHLHDLQTPGQAWPSPGGFTERYGHSCDANPAILTDTTWRGPSCPSVWVSGSVLWDPVQLSSPQCFLCFTNHFHSNFNSIFWAISPASATVVPHSYTSLLWSLPIISLPIISTVFQQPKLMGQTMPGMLTKDTFNGIQNHSLHKASG